MKFQASYNGRIIEIEAKDEKEATYKALQRFQAVRRYVNIWKKIDDDRDHYCDYIEAQEEALYANDLP